MPRKFIRDGIEVKQCSKCKQIKETSFFSKRKQAKEGINGECKQCRIESANSWYADNKERACKQTVTWRQRNKEKVKAYDLTSRVRQYGITVEAYNSMYQKQNGCCDICGINESLATRGSLCIDHDHATGKVRALLCLHCNAGLGNFRESEERLNLAIQYIKKHKSNV